ncbi:MAG: glycosyltransferase [Acidobacteriota bacterium]
MVSVIIPTFNRRTRLPRAVESVRGQTFQDWELIVIDDGSTDDTAEWLSGLREPRLRYLRTPHRGVSHARNIGIAAARHPWLAFLDSDDAWHPRKLATQLEALESEDDRYLLCHTEEIWIRRGRRVNPRLRHRKYSGWVYRPSLDLCVISPSSVLLHRSVLESFGMFDETYPVCEDYELWLRITTHLPVLFVPQPLTVKYGGHSDQLSHSRWGLDRYRVRALLSRLCSGELTFQQQVWTRRALAEKAAILARGYANRGKPGPAAAYARLASRCRTLPVEIWEPPRRRRSVATA